MPAGNDHLLSRGTHLCILNIDHYIKNINQRLLKISNMRLQNVSSMNE